MNEDQRTEVVRYWWSKGNVERLRLCTKYGVSSLQEMDELVAQGKVDEEIILTDFQRVDFLTAKLRKLDELMPR